MLAPIVEEQGLGAALALVIAGARADGIDVAPIVLWLGMDGRVALDLAGRGLEDLGLDPLGQAQHVDRPLDAGLGGLHRVELIFAQQPFSFQATINLNPAVGLSLGR